MPLKKTIDIQFTSRWLRQQHLCDRWLPRPSMCKDSLKYSETSQDQEAARSASPTRRTRSYGVPARGRSANPFSREASAQESKDYKSDGDGCFPLVDTAKESQAGSPTPGKTPVKAPAWEIQKKHLAVFWLASGTFTTFRTDSELRPKELPR